MPGPHHPHPFLKGCGCPDLERYPPGSSPWAGRIPGAWWVLPLAWPPPLSPHCSSQTRWSSSLGPQPHVVLQHDGHLRKVGPALPLPARDNLVSWRPQLPRSGTPVGKGVRKGGRTEQVCWSGPRLSSTSSETVPACPPPLYERRA